MNLEEVRARMQKAIDNLVAEIGTLRTGRATPGLVQNIVVAVYGGTQRFKILELASITAPDPSMLVISPWDKSVIGEIKKGIEAANVGLNPGLDGEIIRISVPQMTTEDRLKFVKILGQKLEEGRIDIRKIRGDEMGNIKRKFEAKEITEDQKSGEEKSLQNLTDESIAKIAEIGKKKENDLLQI